MPVGWGFCMSRTYRRKTRKPEEWVTSDYKRVDGVWQRVPYTGKQLKEEINKFHSDKGVGDFWPVPAWFRRDLNRLFRAKHKAEARRIHLQGDYEEYSFKPFKKDASWNWW